MKKIQDKFDVAFYASKDGAETPDWVAKNLEELHLQLLIIQDWMYGMSQGHATPDIYILSGYRSPKHNRKVGGARNSQHMKGTAADIQIALMTPVEVAQMLRKLMDRGIIKTGGIGLYKTFVHYDIRGRRAFWKGSRVKADF